MNILRAALNIGFYHSNNRFLHDTFVFWFGSLHHFDILVSKSYKCITDIDNRMYWILVIYHLRYYDEMLSIDITFAVQYIVVCWINNMKIISTNIEPVSISISIIKGLARRTVCAIFLGICQISIYIIIHLFTIQIGLHDVGV